MRWFQDILWLLFILRLVDVPASCAGSCRGVRQAPRNTPLSREHGWAPIPLLRKGRDCLHLRGGLEVDSQRNREDGIHAQRRQDGKKRGRTSFRDNAPNCPPSASSAPKRTRVRSASADRRRRNRSVSPFPTLKQRQDKVWRSGALLGFTGLNVPCDGQLEEPIIDVMDEMYNISWPEVRLPELRNGGMEDDIAFLQANGGEEAITVGKAARDWAMHTLGKQPRSAQRGRGKTPASLARAQARMAQITESLRSLSPALNETQSDKREAVGEEEAGGESLARRRVLVCDVPDGATAEEVAGLLSVFGEVEGVHLQPVMLFACVTFRDEAAQAAALERGFVNFRGFQLELKAAPALGMVSPRFKSSADNQPPPNATVVVSRIRGRFNEPAGTGMLKRSGLLLERRVAQTDAEGRVGAAWAESTVVVHNLPPDANETLVRTAFVRCGRIASVTVGHVTTEGASSFAVVRFTSADALHRAALLDGTKVGGREVRVRQQGHTKSVLETLSERSVVDVEAEMAESLQVQNMPGAGQK